RNQAEESDRLKSAFLANISHEIRTPLNAIVGFSDVLPMVSSEEEREQLIGLIKQNNAHLLRLIDNIVHISKLEVGGEAVKKTRFEIKPLLEEAVTRHASRVDAARIQMKTQVADEVQELYTDRDRLLEILNQYVDNAVKFTTDGEITLGCDVQGQLLRVWVRDTGKGIPADCCNDHLFERFVKVDEFVPGTGLGLSICRSIAQSLGGKVGVQSTLGEGSLFWAELPVG
ncbi:MAG: HAMP domain-containing histidine kinase, partial [Prevotella sp.]|nr:HAMP domain-containing histidine kinase [Prevotella sp.]